MGTDKAAVVVDGVPMRTRVRASLAATCDMVVQLGGIGDGVDVVLPDDGQGPFLAVLGLLRSGLAERYVVVAVDQPLIEPGTLQCLLDADPGGDGGVSYADEPVPCVVRAAAVARVERLAAAGERRLRALATTTIAPDARQRRTLVNVNTPIDLAAIVDHGHE
jgi:molybdopterin-guanine dinucleotide biosynthesis protein A